MILSPVENDSVLLQGAMQTLQMIASAHVYRDADKDPVILSSYRDLAANELAMIEQKKLENLRELMFQGRCPDEEYEREQDLNMEAGV